ncbi:MAG: hypothetical protein HY001_04215 [Candidatus Portnoybacteria bacterium]|nr:hypothetical protein [Candidatus Portnoybacteria bacterium]
MNMQNPYEDLIKIIDIILRKMELADKKMIGLLITEFSTSGGPEHPAHRIKFFQRLKKASAIKDFSVMKMAGMPHGFILNQPNKQRLIEERNRLINFDQPQATKRSIARSTENKGPIKKLELVKPRTGNKFKVVINEDYLNPIYGDRAISSWDLLFRIAEGDIVDADNHKNAIDYFNFNEKCQLYTKTGHTVTKILKVEGGYISPAIEIEIITEKAFQQRANKS